MLNIIHDYLKVSFNKKKLIVNSAKTAILKIADGQIEYSRFGKGNPLIMVMGYGGSMNGWDLRFLNKLAQENEVIVFSNRNTGKSYFKDKDYTVTEMANDIEQLRLGLKLSKVSLCGISMGGAISQQYAYTYPTFVKNMILINTFPPGDLINMPQENTIETLKNITKRNFTTYLKLSNILFPSIWQTPSLALFHFKPKGSKNIVSNETLREQQKVLDLWSEIKDSKLLLDSIKIPTLIQVGELDQLIPPSNSRVLNSYIKSSQLLKYEKGGHVMIYQEPFKVAKDIINFLQKN